MPDPAGAATRRIETSAPECSPIPRNSMSDRMVCSGWALWAKRGNSEQIRTPDYSRVMVLDCGRITTLSTSRGDRCCFLFSGVADRCCTIRTFDERYGDRHQGAAGCGRIPVGLGEDRAAEAGRG